MRTARPRSRQPPHIRRFPSVLDELDGPACRAVTGVAESEDVLHDLSAENGCERARLNASPPCTRSPPSGTRCADEYDRAAVHLTTRGDDKAAYALLRDHSFDVLLSGALRRSIG